MTLPEQCELITRIAAEHYGVDKQELLSPSRVQSLVEARAISAKIMRDKGVTLKKIGRMHNRHHTTIVHLLRMIDDRIALYKQTQYDYNNIIQRYNELSAM